MSDFDEQSSSNKRRIPSPSSISASGSASNKRAKASPSSDKANRGLRHFSMMVSKKVEEKGTTTYNEVADELVKKVISERKKEDPTGKFDEKNIRRRVYDALNVLMALDIITKDKKEITWNGLPASRKQSLDSLKDEIEHREQQLKHKRDALRDLLVQQVCFRNLVMRNMSQPIPEERIPVPFIVVNTHSSSVIQCDMSRDRTDVMFDFTMPFEINDDNTILKKMGMDKTYYNELQGMLPRDMLDYCQRYNLLDPVLDQTDVAVANTARTHQHIGRSSSAADHYHPHSYYDSLGP